MWLCYCCIKMQTKTIPYQTVSIVTKYLYIHFRFEHECECLYAVVRYEKAVKGASN